MGTLIDTSVLIAIERGQLELDSLLVKQAEEGVALAAITASELLHGVHRAGKAAHRARREAFVEQQLAHLTVVPFDLVAARIHARIWAGLAAKGVTVGAHDLLIAATALATDFRLATRDERSFPQTHDHLAMVCAWQTGYFQPSKGEKAWPTRRNTRQLPAQQHYGNSMGSLCL